MKITQEVRDFAAKQNQEADAFLAAHPPRNGEGGVAATSDLPGVSRSREAGSQGEPLAQPNGGGGEPLDATSAEQGMAAMSKVFRETGSELYMGAGDRERD